MNKKYSKIVEYHKDFKFKSSRVMSTQTNEIRMFYHSVFKKY